MTLDQPQCGGYLETIEHTRVVDGLSLNGPGVLDAVCPMPKDKPSDCPVQNIGLCIDDRLDTIQGTRLRQRSSPRRAVIAAPLGFSASSLHLLFEIP